ncbi:hypothetical protein ACFQL1_01425 [Halomicroarcula sp. GCM10025709]|uniref:hypothetical protein n=1 Tax=Halomicroarcula sp. GCM10025709 TaxID=3252669 RepID=UPI00360A7178
MKTAVTAREVMNREFVGASESDDLYETAELLVREDERTALVLRGTTPSASSRSRTSSDTSWTPTTPTTRQSATPWSSRSPRSHRTLA